MHLKVHRAPDGSEVVAVCDRELLGKTLTHGKLQVRVTKEFYGENPATEEEVRKALRNGDNINLMGRRVVDLAVSMGIVEECGCILIGSVPHAQIVRL